MSSRERWVLGLLVIMIAAVALLQGGVVYLVVFVLAAALYLSVWFLAWKNLGKGGTIRDFFGSMLRVPAKPCDPPRRRPKDR